ncbi:MAG: hypothetical protein ACK4H7_03160 [Acidilobaceae archaeon]
MSSITAEHIIELLEKDAEARKRIAELLAPYVEQAVIDMIESYRKLLKESRESEPEKASETGTSKLEDEGG